MIDSVIILSVGNPGPVTRHSVGNFLLKHILHHYSFPELVKRGPYSLSTDSSNSIMFVKSNSYMNESAKAFQNFTRNEKISTNSTFVILYDDFETPLGSVKIGTYKKNESHGGIKSIKNSASEYPNVFKLGIGIGPKPQLLLKETMGAWVLSLFLPVEKKTLEDIVVDKVIQYLDEFLAAGGEVDCNKLNARMTKKFKSEEK